MIDNFFYQEKVLLNFDLYIIYLLIWNKTWLFSIIVSLKVNYIDRTLRYIILVYWTTWIIFTWQVEDEFVHSTLRKTNQLYFLGLFWQGESLFSLIVYQTIFQIGRSILQFYLQWVTVPVSQHPSNNCCYQGTIFFWFCFLLLQPMLCPQKEPFLISSVNFVLPGAQVFVTDVLSPVLSSLPLFYIVYADCGVNKLSICW